MLLNILADEPKLAIPTQRTSPGNKRGEVALVCMPWGAVGTPSLAMGLLKTLIQQSGFTPALHYLSVRFAERIGLELYEKIAGSSFYQTEWFFSQALFGPGGSGELRNSWTELNADPSSARLVGFLRDIVGLSDEVCQRIALDEVSPFIEECLGVDWGRYMVVGFTTTFSQSLSSVLLAKRIKEQHPHVKIVFGGANVDSEMGVEFMRAFPWIDYVVHGEAENTFPVLLDNIASGRPEQSVPAISMRKEGVLVPGDKIPSAIVDMSQVPSPDYSDYVAELDRSGFRKRMQLTLYFESSRGCWWGAKHHCTFCGLNGSTMTYRKKDADRVYSELMSLSNDYRCLYFSATDNILANEYFTELLPRLVALDADIRLFYEVKANLRREQLALLRSAGITKVQPGIESFSTRLLQLMRKGVTSIQNIQLLKWCYEFDIDPGYNLLYGFPQETAEDYQGLPRLFELIGHLRPPNHLSRVEFERFSPYFFDRDRFQLELRPWVDYEHLYPKSRVDLEKIAYFFQGAWEGQQADPEEYVEPARASWRLWNDNWQSGSVYCYYEKGPGYLRILDNRPREGAASPRMRGFHLHERLAALYLLCDEAHSLRTICSKLQERFGPEVSEQTIQSWLDQLVSQRLMFQEGDRYLALAVRKPQRQRQPAV